VSAPSNPAAPERRLDAAQAWLFQRVTRPLDAPLPEPTADARWVVSGSLPSRERIAVYQRAYFSRLVECLRDDYPALAHALGDHDFEAVCLEFIESHPPASASLNYYGAPFADFLATWPAPHAAFASELARLEWAVVECIHADAERNLEPRELGGISEEQWQRVRLSPSPAAKILATCYPVHQYYQAFLEGQHPEPPAFEACTIAVCRRGDRVWRFGVNPRFAGLLRRLMSGEPLTTALAGVPGAANAGSSDAAELQLALSEWVAYGLFAGVRFD
jgi:hypothetical protein